MVAETRVKALPSYVKRVITPLGNRIYRVASATWPDRWHTVDMTRGVCSQTTDDATCWPFMKDGDCVHIQDVRDFEREHRIGESPRPAMQRAVEPIRPMRLEMTMAHPCSCGRRDPATGAVYPAAVCFQDERTGKRGPALCGRCWASERCRESRCLNQRRAGSEYCGQHGMNALVEAFDADGGQGR